MIVGVVLAMIPVKEVLMQRVDPFTFAGMILLITAAYNTAFFLFFRKTEEFRYLWKLVRQRAGKRR